MTAWLVALVLAVLIFVLYRHRLRRPEGDYIALTPARQAWLIELARRQAGDRGHE